MLGKLILIFIIVPLMDLTLLMMMSKYTGWPFSIAMVVLSGIIGAYLAKRSYRGVLKRFHERAASGQLGADLLSDGAMIFFAAGLLLTPGFITDAVGLSLLIPRIRGWYKSWIGKWFKRNFNIQVITPPTSGYDKNVVDGEVVGRPTEEPLDDFDGETIEVRKIE